MVPGAGAGEGLSPAPGSGPVCVCVLGTAAGGIGAIEGLSAGSWSRTVGHSPCAGCWEEGVCVFPQPGVRGLCICNSLESSKLH